MHMIRPTLAGRIAANGNALNISVQFKRINVVDMSCSLVVYAYKGGVQYR